MQPLRFNILYLLLGLVLSIPLLAGIGKSQGLENGQQAFNAGNHAHAFALWQTEATRGNPQAQVFVGLAYANGWGVDKSPELAGIWYRKAAINNNTSGQFLLGLYYIQQQGDKRADGLHWLQRAAQGGDAEAQAFLDKGHAKGWFRDIQPQ